MLCFKCCLVLIGRVCTRHSWIACRTLKGPGAYSNSNFSRFISINFSSSVSWIWAVFEYRMHQSKCCRCIRAIKIIDCQSNFVFAWWWFKWSTPITFSILSFNLMPQIDMDDSNVYSQLILEDNEFQITFDWTRDHGNIIIKWLI